ncbi:MAG: hypothetical protein KIS62_06870 [Ramlibacter sp.]|nr:hypothetical protein [Ramlibacter sp.]
MKEDFASLDQKYMEIRETRLPSGIFAANQMIRALAGVRSRAQSQGALIQGNDFSKLKQLEIDYASELDEKSARWVKTNPNSVLALIVQSEMFVRHGFVFRQTASSASDEQEYVKYLAKARTVLDASSNGPKDPGWYFQMLRIARFQGWSPQDYSKLLEEAVVTHPYYYDIYFAAAEFLLPQWHGNLDLIENFVRFAEQRTKNKEGHSMYARVYWHLAAFGHDNIFHESRIEWKRMRDGFDDVVKRYPDSWNFNAYARFACQARDRGTAKRLFARIGTQVEQRAWKSRIEFNRCRMWASSKNDIAF